MADLNRRLNAIEKRLRIDKEADVYPSAVIGGGPSPEDEERLGPVETWITYREQVQAQENADGEHWNGLPIVIVINAEEEYRRRSERKCQTLSED